MRVDIFQMYQIIHDHKEVCINENSNNNNRKNSK